MKSNNANKHRSSNSVNWLAFSWRARPSASWPSCLGPRGLKLGSINGADRGDNILLLWRTVSSPRRRQAASVSCFAYNKLTATVYRPGYRSPKLLLFYRETLPTVYTHHPHGQFWILFYMERVGGGSFFKFAYMTCVLLVLRAVIRAALAAFLSCPPIFSWYALYLLLGK